MADHSDDDLPPATASQSGPIEFFFSSKGHRVQRADPSRAGTSVRLHLPVSDLATLLDRSKALSAPISLPCQYMKMHGPYTSGRMGYLIPLQNVEVPLAGTSLECDAIITHIKNEAGSGWTWSGKVDVGLMLESDDGQYESLGSYIDENEDRMTDNIARELNELGKDEPNLRSRFRLCLKPSILTPGGDSTVEVCEAHNKESGRPLRDRNTISTHTNTRDWSKDYMPQDATFELGTGPCSTLPPLYVQNPGQPAYIPFMLAKPSDTFVQSLPLTVSDWTTANSSLLDTQTGTEHTRIAGKPSRGDLILRLAFTLPSDLPGSISSSLKPVV